MSSRTHYTIYPMNEICPQRYLKPLATDPSVEEIKRCFWLIHWNHVPSTEYLHKSEVSASLEFSSLIPILEL